MSLSQISGSLTASDRPMGLSALRARDRLNRPHTRSADYLFGVARLIHGGTGGDSSRNRWINSAVSI
jgi:hypothetical protein